MNPRLNRCAFIAALVLVQWCAAGAAPLVQLRGSDFTGGAAELFGAAKYGARGVNYIYAAPNGLRATMTARFSLHEVPNVPVALHVRARLDDRNTDCPIRITLNSVALLEGPNAFGHGEFEWRTYPIAAGALRVGENELTFANIAPEGKVGMPPWFMLARCAFAPEGWSPSARPTIEEDFQVTLPTEKRPMPEPLTGEHRRPGFRFRGTKGWLWRPEQYLAEIPTLAQFKMNFLMNCYGSMCDIEHFPWGSPDCNRWWEPLPEEKRKGFEQVVRECRARGITYCFSLNPNICSRRAVDYDSAEDFDLLWQHYAWMQGLGVRWFNIQFDDISQGMDPSGQARLTNELLARLRKTDPEAQMILCPVYYWGTGREPGAQAYLEVLARELYPDTCIFWTGDAVVGPITRAAAESYRSVVKHRLFIWDNYPVNDSNPTLHLGPLMKRDRDLCEVADGYMSNPLCPQNEANRIPLLTTADYAYNPYDYDPARSIGQAILHLAGTRAQRDVLRDLVELYPGMILYDQGTAYNPVIDRFAALLDEPHSRWLADAYIRHVEAVSDGLKACFHGTFSDARRTIEGNLAEMRRMYGETYGP